MHVSARCVKKNKSLPSLVRNQWARANTVKRVWVSYSSGGECILM